MWIMIKQALYDYFHSIQSIKSLLPPKPPMHNEKEHVRKFTTSKIGSYITKEDIRKKINEISTE